MPNHKAPDSLPSLMEALQRADADSKIKNAAFHFLRADLSRLESLEDFMGAFDGLAAAQQILGVLHPNYRKTLDDMRKTLSDCYQVKERSLKVWFKEDVRDLWEQVGETLKEDLDKAKWHIWDEFVQKCFKE